MNLVLIIFLDAYDLICCWYTYSSDGAQAHREVQAGQRAAAPGSGCMLACCYPSMYLREPTNYYGNEILHELLT